MTQTTVSSLNDICLHTYFNTAILMGRKTIKGRETISGVGAP
jgi:uncharacterized protein YqfB (UPF0267 family)